MRTSFECLLIALIGRVLFEAATAQSVREPITPAEVFEQAVQNDEANKPWTEPTPIPTPTPTPVNWR